MNYIHSENQLTAGARSTLMSLLPKSRRDEGSILNILQKSESLASRKLDDIYINNDYSFCFFVNNHSKKIEKVLPTHGKKFESLLRNLKIKQEFTQTSQNEFTELDFNDIWNKVDNIVEQVADLQEQLDNISFHREYYQEKIKIYENKTSDLLHVIELGEFNISQGYALSKELQELRNKRRVEKSKLESLVYFQGLLSRINIPEKQHIGLSSPRIYNFREATELQHLLKLNNTSIKDSSKL